ncbi:MAG: YciI family protein [Sinimarinibacterium flocculans]|uniref:YciI family protein n=1 Tax=Sinimarinibacterium flocculans TaxID=985250 RepID=UPI003C605403
MLFVVRFTDKPQCLSVRKQFLAAHLQWLEQHQQSVLVAGSVRPDPEAAPVGAFWVVEAQDKSAAHALFATDPFWLQGLRQSVEVLHYSKAFPERRVPV